MKKIVKDTQLDTQEYGIYSKKTGEVLPDDSYDKVMLRQEKDEVSLSSKEYVTLDIARLEYLVSKGIDTNLVGLLFKVVPFTEMVTNRLIQKNGKPHTSGSLAKAIGMSPQHTKKTLDKLVLQNLIALHNPKKRGESKFYCLNPYLVRRGRTVSSLLPVLFNDALPKATDAWSKK